MQSARPRPARWELRKPERKASPAPLVSTMSSTGGAGTCSVPARGHGEGAGRALGADDGGRPCTYAIGHERERVGETVVVEEQHIGRVDELPVERAAAVVVVRGRTTPRRPAVVPRRAADDCARRGRSRPRRRRSGPPAYAPRAARARARARRGRWTAVPLRRVIRLRCCSLAPGAVSATTSMRSRSSLRQDLVGQVVGRRRKVRSVTRSPRRARCSALPAEVPPIARGVAQRRAPCAGGSPADGRGARGCSTTPDPRRTRALSSPHLLPSGRMERWPATSPPRARASPVGRWRWSGRSTRTIASSRSPSSPSARGCRSRRRTGWSGSW